MTRRHQAQADAQQEQAEQGCSVADRAFVNQDGGTVTINGVGGGCQLAAFLPTCCSGGSTPKSIVIAKLDEIKGVPADNARRAT